MERYITDEAGERTAVILPIEEYEALVEVAEDAEDSSAMDDLRERLSRGEDEMVPYHEARKAWADDPAETP